MRTTTYLLSILMYFVIGSTQVAAQEVSLPADHPAAQDLGRLNSKLKTLEYNQQKGKAPSEYDAQSIRKYLDSCKEKASDQNWGGYETKVASLEAMYQEASAAENARKEQLQALDREMDEQLDAISQVYSLKRVTSQSPFSFNTTGAEYEAAARLINFARMETLWEEIKKVNPSKRGDLKFNPNYGENIAGFKAGYPAFVEVILEKKIDENLERAKSANPALALSLTKEALSYANGGLILQPGHPGLSSRQEKARAKISAIGAEMGTKYAGPFHAANIGKAFPATKDVNLATASAADFPGQLNSGQSLYIYHFLLGPIGTISKTSSNPDGQDGYKTAHVKIRIDGETIMDNELATDLKDDKNSSYYKLMVIPSEADMNTDWWRTLAKNNAGIDFSDDALRVHHYEYLALFKALSEQKAGEHEMQIEVSNGSLHGGDGVSDNVTLKFNLDPNYYAQLAQKVQSDIVDAMRMFKSVGSEPAKEARIRQYMSGRGTILHVSRLSDLSVREYYSKYHEKYPGLPKRQSQSFQCAWKDAKGDCYFCLVSYDEIWEGRWVDKGFQAPAFSGIPIRCENVKP